MTANTATESAAQARLARRVLGGLELKSSSGRLSHAQVDMHRRLSEAGMKVATAYGLSAALDQLDTWGLMRE